MRDDLMIHPEPLGRLGRLYYRPMTTGLALYADHIFTSPSFSIYLGMRSHSSNGSINEAFIPTTRNWWQPTGFSLYLISVKSISLAVAMLVAMAAPTTFAQPVHVTDGDTIRLGGTIYRLWGIDAPETKQWCGDYPAGVQATAALEKLMAGKTISCEDRGGDRYGRRIGLCRANGDDLGAAMVRLGHAWAFVRYSSDYVAQETKAKSEKLGIHSHACQPAWEWRAGQRP